MGVVHIVLLCLAIIAGTVLALIAVSLIRTLLTKPGVSTYTPAPDPESPGFPAKGRYGSRTTAAAPSWRIVFR